MVEFYHIHVPKTGGMSLIKYASSNGLLWDSEGGHKSFSERTIPDGKVTITALRCPIAQTISIYSFWKYGTSIYTPSKSIKGFSDWIRNPGDLYVKWPSGNWKWLPNLYVSFFGDGNFDVAIENISSINHVLDTSDLESNFKEVSTVYNLPQFSTHTNVSKRVEISDDDRKYIKKIREEDFEICKRFNINTM